MTTDKPRFKGEEAVGYSGKLKEVETDFTYYAHTDPDLQAYPNMVTGDVLERERAEVLRAKMEGREPDLENPPPSQGTPVAPSHVVASTVPFGYVVEPSFTAPVAYGGYNEASRRSPEEALELETKSRERKREAEDEAAEEDNRALSTGTGKSTSTKEAETKKPFFG